MPNEQTLIRTPSGFYVPASTVRGAPRAVPQQDPWRVLAPWIESPRDRIGRRKDPAQLGVHDMMDMWPDEVIALITAYLGTLLVNATYTIECSDTFTQGFFKAMYDEAHRDVMLKSAPSLFFGFQGLIKNWAWRVPTSDPVQAATLWSRVTPPLILDDVDQIDPRQGMPQFADGAFTGIKLDDGTVVPPYEALWMVVGQWRGFGSYLGWGRARTAYKGWWTKQFTEDQRLLFIQRGVDPVPIARYPEGTTKDGRSHQLVAFDVGELARAGATVAMPSDQSERGVGFQWDLSYLVNNGNVEPFERILDREDRRIAMGMLVPYQAILESKSYGLGGPNTAEVLGEMAEHILLQDAIDQDRHINEYVFPVINAANFGPHNPPVFKRTTGLNAKAKAHLLDVLKAMLARTDVDPSVFDMRGLGDALDVPLHPEVAQPTVPAAPAVPAPASQPTPPSSAPQVPTRAATERPQRVTSDNLDAMLDDATLMGMATRLYEETKRNA